MLRIAVCVLFASTLAACAATSQPGSDQVVVGDNVVDVQKMAAVENAARRSGVKVMWMHLPTKPRAN